MKHLLVTSYLVNMRDKRLIYYINYDIIHILINDYISTFYNLITNMLHKFNSKPNLVLPLSHSKCKIFAKT